MLFGVARYSMILHGIAWYCRLLGYTSPCCNSSDGIAVSKYYMVLDGIIWYYMVLHSVVQYCMLYCMVLYGNTKYWQVLHGSIWYSMTQYEFDLYRIVFNVFHGIIWDWVLLHFFALQCLVNIRLIHSMQSYIVSCNKL